jgi:SAM-dependent methyltransferase
MATGPGVKREKQADVPETLGRNQGFEQTSLPVSPSSTSSGMQTASAARVYDFWLGGRDSLAVDRRVGSLVAGLVPGVPVAARANRRFLVRAVSHLARNGVRQFLDIGSGLPTDPNVHQVAQRFCPDARVAYVDNDPIVASYGRALLAEDARTVVVQGDARSPAVILTDPLVADHFDWSQPVGLLLVAVLHFLVPDDDPYGVVAAFRKALAPGSAIVVSHATPGPPEQAETMARAVESYADLAVPFTPRTAPEIADFFTDLDLLDPPGLASVDQWRISGEKDSWPTAPWAVAPSPKGDARVDGLAGIGMIGDRT